MTTVDHSYDDLPPLPSPEIPWQWQIGWNRLSTPFARMDTEHIGESLFVASCGPHVLDFGYYTRDNGWAYVLTICEGAFCGQTPLVVETFADREAALTRLSHWLAKLAAECDATGATLERVTQSEPRGPLTCHFNPPVGPRLVNPTAKYIWSLLIWQSARYWLGGCGDASLRFTDTNGATVSELVFLLREPYGVYVLFLPVVGTCSIASRLDHPLNIDTDVELTHSGAPLTIPRRMLISRGDAAEIAKSYIDTATGERPPHDSWES